MFCSTQMPHLADTLGSSLRYLMFSFEQMRGVTTVQALQDHGLTPLFISLIDQPCQGIGLAIHSCRLGETACSVWSTRSRKPWCCPL